MASPGGNRKRPARQPEVQREPPGEQARSPVSADLLVEVGARAGIDADGLWSLREWLGEQLLSDELAKLGQGGHTEDRIPLRRVFVDLPISDRPFEETDSQGRRSFFLRYLASRRPSSLSVLFDPSEAHEVFAEEGALSGSGAPGRDGRRRAVRTGSARPRAGFDPAQCGVLLIGGPGQGKSTLGQLACQLHRAALLRPRAAELPTSVHDVLRQFEVEGESGIPLPAQPLFPLRIVLPEAAAWLTAPAREPADTDAPPALLGFLAAQPSARKAKLRADTLAAMAASMPVFLLLDGFDEVGSPEDRERVVNAAHELLSALGRRGGSAVVVVTTRPQGYADEMARVGVPLLRRYLAPLRVEEALEYARKLIEAKIQGADRQASAMEKLRAAADEGATRRLLRAPLQVTILVALVQQQGGRMPRERWKLFWSYFDFTYRREIERESYASALLASRRTHIEAIHARAGLLLQVESENTGGAAARMTRKRLESIADAVLEEDEIADEERADLVQRIVDAAEKRLVFLVEPEPGSFGFEIRSLQELMAAWALSEGRETSVEARLLQVAKAPMFRNVLLLMASKLFSERSPLREVLADRLCGALDEDAADPLCRLTRAGALLALELLEEGSALGQPKRARALMERACGLLELPPEPEVERLARLASEDIAPVLRGAVESRLARAAATGDVAPALAAWACVVAATNLGHAWARAVADAYWGSLKEPVRLVQACKRAMVDPSGWLVSKLRREGLDGLITEVLSSLTLLLESEKAWGDEPDVWRDLQDKVHRGVPFPSLDEALLVRRWEELGPAHPFASEIIWIMRRALQSRRSGLAEPGVWGRMGLPRPYPAVGGPAAQKAVLPDEPVVLTELHVQHLRVLGDLKLTFEPPPPGKGQWIVLIGANGVGKTTILRSLALALRDLTDPKIWPKGAFATSWRANDGPGEAKIAVDVAGIGPQITRVHSNGSESFTQSPPQPSSRLFPLFAYGCRRGSAMGGAARALDLDDDDGPEVATLFDERASLIHADTWLVRWHSDAADRERAKIVFDAIREGLRRLWDVDSVEVKRQGVWVSGAAVGQSIPMSALSDGYVTTAGWFLDLIARWITLAEKLEVPITADFMERMTGLVLLDEIDLHLHPKWQVDVVDRVRKLLPRMSFVVTTHNPLTLVGAKPEEIWRFYMEGGKVHAERGAESPMLLTGGQIYSRYFGIQDLYPNDLGRKLRRYGFLSGYALRTDEEQAQMEALRDELRRAGVDPGWEEVPREPLPDLPADGTSAKRPSKKPRRRAS